jgi:glycosyltransferase involved in cell wall biosynthesis
MKNNNAVSVIVPTLNEADNIGELVQRVDATLKKSDISYEMIVIDDHSTDNTVQNILVLSSSYNIRVVQKRGKPGKAYSLLEGFDIAQNPIICMIDADLQYPPEAIGAMHKMLTSTGADVVITERTENETSFMRKLSSKTFNFLFARVLFGIGYDTQSGLKIFRKNILEDFQLSPSPWSFDLEFLVRSLENKRSIVSHSIPFTERNAGVTKVKVINVTFELAKASIALRVNTSFQKLRAGLRANSRFVARTFPLLLAGASIFAVMSLSSNSASALSLTKVEPLMTTLQTSTSTPTTTTPMTPTQTPPPLTTANISNPQMSPISAAPATFANPQSQPASSNATVSAQPQNTTYQNQTALSSRSTYSKALTVSAPASTATVAFQNNDSLSPATAAKPYSAFANGYPIASITTATKNTLTRFSIIALSIGFLSILTAILIKAFNRTKTVTVVQKIQR